MEDLGFSIPDLSDVPDLKPLEEGEYELQVEKVKMIKNRDETRSAIMLICDVVGEDDAEDVIHSIWLPSSMDDPDKAMIMKRMLKEFVVAVGLDPDGLEPSHFEGLNFSAKLKLTEFDGRQRNEIARVL